MIETYTIGTGNSAEAPKKVAELYKKAQAAKKNKADNP